MVNMRLQRTRMFVQWYVNIFSLVMMMTMLFSLWTCTWFFLLKDMVQKKKEQILGGRLFVRTVWTDEVNIILDSGSDATVFPYEFVETGKDTNNLSQLWGAQGHPCWVNTSNWILSKDWGSGTCIHINALNFCRRWCRRLCAYASQNLSFEDCLPFDQSRPVHLPPQASMACLLQREEVQYSNII